MTVPRLLHLDGDRLHQSPAPELLSLRRGESWQCGHVPLGPESTLAVPGVVGSSFLDIEVGWFVVGFFLGWGVGMAVSVVAVPGVVGSNVEDGFVWGQGRV